MLRHERSAPIWLFSFVDLAFLLLIAFTQIGPDHDAADNELATLELPRILGPGTPADGNASAAPWQLRVHPLAAADAEGAVRAPFTLVEPGTDALAAPPVDATLLATHLELLEQRAVAKPILAPHPDARAEDLLVAVALLDGRWDARRSVTVRPGPDVAAEPREAPSR